MSDELPEGWASTTLDETCSVITDGTHQTPEYAEQGVPFISTTNLRPFTTGLDFSQYRRFISHKAHAQLTKRCKPEKGDILKQQRIVAKLETLLGRVDASQQRLAKIPVLLKRFRQSVLAAACSGRLTADWREENPDVEDAASLLETVKEQRAARHQAECADAKRRGQQTPKLEWSDENPDFSDYDLPDLPDTWQWSNVSKFGFVKGGKRLPKGEALVEENTGHPYLRIRDLRDGSVDRSEILYVPKHVYPSIQNYIIRSSDVYLTIVGTIGDAGTIPPDFDGANLTENAAKIVQPVGLIPEFLAAWFRSPHCQKTIQQNIHSGGQGKLALFRIEQLPVPLAPLPEQQEIVRRVEGLFALADQLEVRLAKARGQVDALTPSLLARAFAGQLVPQDPNDEPASTLLERIKDAT